MVTYSHILKIAGLCLILYFPLDICISQALCSDRDKQIVGWVEVVTIRPGNLEIKAKLDTGANNSSLNALDMVEFERDGNTVVQFQITNHAGQTRRMEATVVRRARIKRHTAGPDHRPVIHLDICLGNVRKQVEVNLVNRSNFEYQMLIGRSFLMDDFIIDVSQTFSTESNCQ